MFMIKTVFMSNPTQTQSWKKLETLLSQRNRGSGDIGEIDPESRRDNNLQIALDLSKSLVSNDIWGELFNLAREQNIEQWRDKMFNGDKINMTEDRAVGHVWLRSGDKPEVVDVLQKMKGFVKKTHADSCFTDIVHIGIGGSDLGPRMVCDALKHLPKKLKSHFVANVDAADIEETLKPLNPETTLICIVSKTFTTQETMMNAAYAKKWLGDLDVAKHMIALSTNEQAVTQFGIDSKNMFPFWDWVGGRFSVWSAIGMPIALAYGFDVLQDFLDGGKAMDDHFQKADLDNNLPVILALFGIWNRNFMKSSALAVLPYAQNLSLLTNFLQQLDMESNGKSVNRKGEFISDYETGPIIFGQAGTNGQHAFHQWLHQGTDIIPCEFITIEGSSYNKDHQNVLNAHAAAQAEAFATGQNHDNNHQYYAGGRPCVTISVSHLSPNSLGQLIALYEHKIFVQGVVWDINSFDQFGVELGKAIAQNILKNFK